jgi:VIT family
VQKELGLSPDTGGAALGDAVVVGATYLGAAIVPLWPYFFFSLHLALAVSLACTLVALFGVGVAKGRITRLSLPRSGLQVMIVGSVSAAVGYAIGHLVTTCPRKGPDWRQVERRHRALRTAWGHEGRGGNPARGPSGGQIHRRCRARARVARAMRMMAVTTTQNSGE